MFDVGLKRFAQNPRKMFDLTQVSKLHTSMSFRETAFKRNQLCAAIFGLLTVPLVAQVPNAPIVFAQSAITTSFVPAPQLFSTGGSSGAQWLKVEFHYAAVPQPPAPDQPASKFVDSAEFRVWIEGRDRYTKLAPIVAVGLTGTVTYLNIPAGRDNYGVFYVPPATLTRYSTDQGPTDFDRAFDIHIEAYVNGTLVDYFNKNKETDLNWFSKLTPVAGEVYTQIQTPFIVSDPDKYPPIKVPTTSSP